MGTDFNKQATEIHRISETDIPVATLAAALSRIAEKPEHYDPAYKAEAFSVVTSLLNNAARQGQMRFEAVGGALVAAFDVRDDRTQMRANVDIIRRDMGLHPEHA